MLCLPAGKWRCEKYMLAFRMKFLDFSLLKCYSRRSRGFIEYKAGVACHSSCQLAMRMPHKEGPKASVLHLSNAHPVSWQFSIEMRNSWMLCGGCRSQRPPNEPQQCIHHTHRCLAYTLRAVSHPSAAFFFTFPETRLWFHHLLDECVFLAFPEKPHDHGHLLHPWRIGTRNTTHQTTPHSW